MGRGRLYSHGPKLMNRNAMMNRYKMPLTEVYNGPTVRCKFCGYDSLFLCGTAKNSHLGCGHCGADGPEAQGIDGAVSAYTALERRGILEWKS